MLQWEYIAEKHKPLLDEFQCIDEPTVRTFLVEESLRFHNQNLARTRLYFDMEDNLVGYFTLYNDMMQIGRKKRQKHGLSELPSYKFYPSIKLHYMGVDSRYRERGYGRFLLLSALSLAKEIAENTGCLFLTVESLNNAVNFYFKHEFQSLSVNGRYLNMVFKLNEF